HRLLRRDRRPDRRPDGRRNPADGAGHLRRHVVQWIIDFGMPGPDRGAGGKFVLVPPGYDGPLPEGGFYVGQSRTNRVLMLGRSFMQENDPAPTVPTTKPTLKLTPYPQGGPGTSVATLLEGTVPPASAAEVPQTRFVEGSGLPFNTIP